MLLIVLMISHFVLIFILAGLILLQTEDTTSMMHTKKEHTIPSDNSTKVIWMFCFLFIINSIFISFCITKDSKKRTILLSKKIDHKQDSKTEHKEPVQEVVQPQEAIKISSDEHIVTPLQAPHVADELEKITEIISVEEKNIHHTTAENPEMATALPPLEIALTQDKTKTLKTDENIVFDASLKSLPQPYITIKTQTWLETENNIEKYSNNKTVVLFDIKNSLLRMSDALWSPANKELKTKIIAACDKKYTRPVFLKKFSKYLMSFPLKAIDVSMIQWINQAQTREKPIKIMTLTNQLIQSMGDIKNIYQWQIDALNNAGILLSLHQDTHTEPGFIIQNGLIGGGESELDIDLVMKYLKKSGIVRIVYVHHNDRFLQGLKKAALVHEIDLVDIQYQDQSLAQEKTLTPQEGYTSMSKNVTKK